MPENWQNTISQTAIKHCNNFRSVRTKDLTWLQINTDTGSKIKVENTVKERDQQLLGLITIDVIKYKQKKSPYQDIIKFSMNPNINSYFNKYTMSW